MSRRSDMCSSQKFPNLRIKWCSEGLYLVIGVVSGVDIRVKNINSSLSSPTQSG